MPVLRLVHDLDEERAFDPRNAHASGAAGISLAAHALFLVGCYLVVTRPAPSGTAHVAEEPVVRPELVWLAAPGPGGGGGGGGNRTPAPPVRLQTRGLDALSMRVLTPPPLTPPRELIEPPPDPPDITLSVPVKPMDAGQLAVMGAVDGSAFAPPDSRGSGSNGLAGTGKNGGSGPGDGPGLGPGQGGGIGGDVFQIGNGITPPQVIRSVRPSYTAEALRRRIQGEAYLTVIVRADGTVTDIRVTRSLDSVFGLDEEAIKAARQWRFKPATRFGQPVAVYVTIGVAFSMH